MGASAAAEPRRFGKYQILERVAAGGMAEIFRARLDGIGGFQRTFAIKRIAPHLSTNHEFVDMLVDEAKIAGLLSHANIVQILDLGSVDQQFYIAMEFVNGRDLGQVLARCAEKGITLPVPHAVFILIEMLKGLEYAHQRQVMLGGQPVPLHIIHRDISPGNVLVSFQGEVKLTDFGIAKASVKALETMSGVIKGRFDYMSPEQAAGQVLDQRSDLYSAGVLFYEMLTGQHPFRKAGELATLEAVRKGAYTPPSEVNPDVPYSLDLVVERALCVRPDDRMATASAFREALDRFFHDSGFIFSASTLAAFLRGLFPEAVPAERRNESEVPTRLLEPNEMESEDDSAASRAPTAPPRALAPLRSPATSSTVNAVLRLEAVRLDPPATEEATLIRPGPRPAAPENPFGESATVIKPPSSAVLDQGETLRLPLPPGEGSTTRTPAVRAESSFTRTPALRSEPTAAPRPAAPALRRPRDLRVPLQVHAVWALVAFACAVAAFVLGLLIGNHMHRAQRPAAPPITE